MVALVGLIPLPIISALLAAALAFATAWQAQSWRYERLIAEQQAGQALQLAQSHADARAAQAALDAKYQGALNDARRRETSLRESAAAARAESDGLRQLAADTARRLAAAPATAVLDYAATASGLLADCSAAYQGLAATADGHTSDVRTLMQAWPVNPRRPDGVTTSESTP